MHSMRAVVMPPSGGATIAHAMDALVMPALFLSFVLSLSLSFDSRG
jgi:hypothetical protein